MYIRLLIVLVGCFSHLSPLFGQETQLADCRVILANNTLTLENSHIRREFSWNGGHLISLRLSHVVTGKSWQLSNSAPDVTLPGTTTLAAGGTLTVQRQPATPIRPAHLTAEITTTLGAVQLRRVFRLYPNCPAIACDYYLRGQLGGGEVNKPTNAGDLGNVETPSALAARNAKATIIDRLALPGTHWRLKAVEFFDVTDHTNTLVQETTLLPYRTDSPLVGNLLWADEALTDNGVFWLKEAPTSSVQLAYPGFDYVAKIGNLRAVGLGLTAADVQPDRWTKGYSLVVGVTSGGELGRLTALRTYQAQVRSQQPGRDEMVLMNTWGDRGQDSRINEAFCVRELRAGKRLGITHFQLDDGWQNGRSSNSAFAGGSLTKIWDNPAYWTPHPDRFPNGLSPVMKLARELGIEVCLWFNPSADSSYAHWKNDADALTRLYQAYGIRTFKIDGVKIPDKTAELNLRRLFDTVMEATGQQAVFNLDVTAGRRFGYHYFNEYGNVFLENRYTDWTNYYPHWTLRNLWMLSKYVPTRQLQIEFLNKWRNTDRYPAGDSLAPAYYPFDYLFAITMMAQPLAWFEGAKLPDEAFEVAPLLQQYRQLQGALHRGHILPIGNEPSGRSWTGFQSVDGQKGYLLVFRERTDQRRGKLKTYLPPGRRLLTKRLAGAGQIVSPVVADEGMITVDLPARQSFGLYEYSLK